MSDGACHCNYPYEDDLSDNPKCICRPAFFEDTPGHCESKPSIDKIMDKDVLKAVIAAKMQHFAINVRIHFSLGLLRMIQENVFVQRVAFFILAIVCVSI